MKYLILAPIITAAIILSGCGQKQPGESTQAPAPAPKKAVEEVQNPSVDKNGNCTSLFTMDYTSLGIDAVALKNAAKYATSMSDIYNEATRLSNGCDKFFKTHPNVTCKAESDYVTKTVSSSDHKNNCNIAKKALGKPTI